MNVVRGFLVGFLLIGWSLPLASHAAAPEGMAFQDFDAARKASIETNTRIFLYFGRYGCPTCDRVNKESFSDMQVKQTYSKNYVLAYVDSESGKRLRLPNGERVTGMSLGIRYQVKGTPTFFFLEPDGSVILKMPGYVSSKQFLGLDLFVTKEYYKQHSLEDFMTSGS